MRKLSAVALCLMMLALTAFVPMSALADTATPTDAVIPVTQTPADPVTQTPTDEGAQTPADSVTQTPTDPFTETPTDSVQTAGASCATIVKIGGLTLSSATSYYHNGADGAVGTVDNVSTNSNAHYDQSTGVLTLDGLDVRNYDGRSRGVIDANGNIKIELNGGNCTVSTKDTDSTYTTSGIYVDGRLTVSGVAMLTATSGAVSVYVAYNGNAGYSYGIYAKTGITVESGIITGTGGTVSGELGRSYGMYADDGNIILNGGSITGTGGIASGKSACSFGIYTENGSVNANGGSITGTGGIASGGKSEHADYFSCSYGVYADGGSVNAIGGSITGRGGLATGNLSRSYGIYAASGSVTADYGTIEANGGAATDTNNPNGHSYGVVANSVSITVNGGSITGKAADANMLSCGVLAITGDIDAADGAIRGESGEAFRANSCGVSAQNGVVKTSGGGSIEGIGGAAGYINGWNGISYGVYAATITSTGGSITGTGVVAHDSYGVYATNDITVSGGTVTGTGGSANVDSCGVYSEESFNVSGGAVTGTSGNATSTYGNSCGIRAEAISVSGGGIDGRGGIATGTNGKSCGVYAESGIIADDGSIMGEGAAAANSYGVRASGSINASGDSIMGNGGAATDSYGVCAVNDITVNGGGSITGIGGAVNGAHSHSYGVYTQSGSVIANAGIEGRGGIAAGEYSRSCGVFANIDITANAGGRIRGYGEAADYDNYGVYANTGSVTAKTDGTIEGSTQAKASTYSYGVYAASTVAAEGGSITGKGGEANANSYGVAAGWIRVQSGSITGEGGRPRVSGGMSCGVNSRYTITAEGGSITGTGGEANLADCKSYGVKGTNITANGSAVITGTGGLAGGTRGESYGVSGSSVTVNGSGEIHGTGGQAITSYGAHSNQGIAANNSGQIHGTGGQAVISYGVYAAASSYGDVAAKDSGSITGTGGNASGVSGISYGVYTNDGAVKAEGPYGTVDGTGGSSADSSYGVYAADGYITVSANGKVKGTGGSITSGNSVGAYSSSSVIVNTDGEIEGIGGTADSGNSYGIQAATMIKLNNGAKALAKGHTQALTIAPDMNSNVAEASTSYDGSNLVLYFPAGLTTYEYFRTPGSIHAVQLTISHSSFRKGQAPANETVTISSAYAGFNATNNFGSATMDGNPIDLGTPLATGTDGSVEDGSIVIHLNPTYLNGLSAGTHTLRVTLAGGPYAGVVLEQQITVAGNSPFSIPSDNPATGDTANIALWTAVAIVAAGVLVIAVKKRRA